MYGQNDIMAAQSMAHEREHELQAALRRRDAAARRAPGVADPRRWPRQHWLHELLVRAHLAHAPVH